MNLEKMTSTLQQAIGEAQQIAMVRKHQEIDIPHFWRALVAGDSFAGNLYRDLGIPLEELDEEIEEELDRISVVEGSSVQYGQNFSQNLYQLLVEADKEKETFQDEYLSTEIVLLALFSLKHNPLTRFFASKDLDAKRMRKKIEEMRGGDRVTSQDQENQYKALEKYGIDLVQAMKSGKHDPIIGRDEEIRDVIRILSRKTKEQKGTNGAIRGLQSCA